MKNIEVEMKLAELRELKGGGWRSGREEGLFSALESGPVQSPASEE